MENISTISSLLNSVVFSYLALGLFIILIIIIGYLYLQLKKKDNYIQLIFF